MLEFACSGPGAGTLIARNTEIGYAHGSVVGVLFLISLVAFSLAKRRWLIPAIMFGLLVFHPAWTISATSGDCGFLKRDASYAFTGLAGLALSVQIATIVRGRRF